jgi:hypothetical protein
MALMDATYYFENRAPLRSEQAFAHTLPKEKPARRSTNAIPGALERAMRKHEIDIARLRLYTSFI